MVTSPWEMVPDWFSKSTSTVCLMVTVLGAGVPLGENFSCFPVNRPTAFARRPSELSFPSKFATPAIPLAGSINPSDPILMEFTLTAEANGVLAASSALMGPAFPEMSTSPLPGSCAVMLNGNCEVKENFSTDMFTLSYTTGFIEEPAVPTDNFPCFTLTLATEKFVGADPPDFADSCACCAEAPPMLEKFHFP